MALTSDRMPIPEAPLTIPEQHHHVARMVLVAVAVLAALALTVGLLVEAVSSSDDPDVQPTADLVDGSTSPAIDRTAPIAEAEHGPIIQLDRAEQRAGR